MPDRNETPESTGGEEVSELNAAPLREGTDYYIENGFMVFTSHFLRRRGYCCESGCRHCPYGFRAEKESEPDVK